jgi:uncharacterized repeat protein (TIGR03803 family)
MLNRFKVTATYLAAAIFAAPLASATSVDTIYAFPNPTPAPFAPYAGLVQLGGIFYGTTYFGGAAGRGTVFAFNPVTNTTQTIYSFTGKDGQHPDAALIAVGSTLYGTTYKGGSAGFGTAFRLNPATGVEHVLHSFAGADGEYPAAALLHVNGALLGTASEGGASGYGTVFKIDPATGAETTVYSFAGGTSDGATPLAGLVDFNGILYGTASAGADEGTVYSVNPSTGAEATLASFGGISNGGSPAAPLIKVGKYLFGTTAGFSRYIGGTVFKFDPATQTETVLHVFSTTNGPDGVAPYGALVAYGGDLYGTTADGGTYGYGTIFRIGAATGTEKVIATFTGKNGSNPAAAMIASGGKLYGTTAGAMIYQSGPYTGEPATLPGSIFSFDPASHTLVTNVKFSGLSPAHQALSSLTGSTSTLYGVAGQSSPDGDSAVFSIDPAKHTASTLASLGGFLASSAPLAARGSLLYGTTRTGGTGGSGSVFSVDPSTGALATIYSFTNTGAGFSPGAPVLPEGKILYGTTVGGGSGGGGTVFSVNSATGAAATLYNFQLSTDGGEPSSGLIGAGGMLYGTAMFGGTGAGFGGVVFAVDPTTATENVVYSFTGGSATGSSDGLYPTTPVVDVGGTLYGTTAEGGANLNACDYGCGVVYAVNPATGAETLLHLFSGGSDGGSPEAGLVNVAGTLYGTTATGGTFGNGTIFSIDPATTTFTTLYNFTGGDDGAAPGATLVHIDGALYGTTNFGGVGNAGTIFRLKL